MLSKARIKYIKSLQIKKYRQHEQRFVVEGEKGVAELLRSDFRTELLLVTNTFQQRYSALLKGFRGECITVKPSELNGLGELKTNGTALAVAVMKENKPFRVDDKKWTLVLDDIRDPGNLGTIMRIADWYALQGIVASPETTDMYNSKVIQASMGSFTRIPVYYAPLSEFLQQQKVPVLGAFLEGENVHRFHAPVGGLLVIGNESAGISGEVARYVTHRITIPRFGGAESLNAAIATAVLCDNLIRLRAD